MLSNSDFFRGGDFCFIEELLEINVLSTTSPPSSDNSLPSKATVSRCPFRLCRADYFFLFCISLYQLAGVF